MPDQYEDFHLAQGDSVTQALSDFSLNTSSTSNLNTCFLNGCWGDPNTNVLFEDQNEDNAGDQCNADGVYWIGQNPDKPRPPRP